MRFVILRTGFASESLRATRGNYEQWFADGMGRPLSDFDVVCAIDGQPLPDPGAIDALLVTGSPHSVHDYADWSVRATHWTRDVVEAGVPTLGVCYGHQMLGDIYGGQVGPNPNGREIGLVEIELYDHGDPLFEGLPRQLPAIITHSDAVNTAPPNAKVIAGNAMTGVQAMSFGPRARTIQWHPEMDASIIRSIITDRAEAINREKGAGAAARIRDAVVDIPWGPVLLRNFARHYVGID